MFSKLDQKIQDIINFSFNWGSIVLTDYKYRIMIRVSVNGAHDLKTFLTESLDPADYKIVLKWQNTSFFGYIFSNDTQAFHLIQLYMEGINV